MIYLGVGPHTEIRSTGEIVIEDVGNLFRIASE